MVPTNIELSRTYEDNESLYAAQHAIDLDWLTKAKGDVDTEGETWIDITFDGIPCIQQVIWYIEQDRSRQIWDCSNAECTCEGDPCERYSLTIARKNTDPGYLPVETDCQYGDVLRLTRINPGWFNAAELVVFGRYHYRE